MYSFRKFFGKRLPRDNSAATEIFLDVVQLFSDGPADTVVILQQGNIMVRYRAHRDILKANSSYFKKKLVPESDTDLVQPELFSEVSVIHVPFQDEQRVFAVLLHWMYDKKQLSKWSNDDKKVYACDLAQSLGMSELLHIVKIGLRTEPVSNLVRYLCIAYEDLGNLEMTNSVLHILAKRLDGHLNQMEDLCGLPFTLMDLVLRCTYFDILKVDELSEFIDLYVNVRESKFNERMTNVKLNILNRMVSNLLKLRRALQTAQRLPARHEPYKLMKEIKEDFAQQILLGDYNPAAFYSALGTVRRQEQQLVKPRPKRPEPLNFCNQHPVNSGPLSPNYVKTPDFVSEGTTWRSASEFFDLSSEGTSPGSSSGRRVSFSGRSEVTIIAPDKAITIVSNVSDSRSLSIALPRSPLPVAEAPTKVTDSGIESLDHVSSQSQSQDIELPSSSESVEKSPKLRSALKPTKNASSGEVAGRAIIKSRSNRALIKTGERGQSLQRIMDNEATESIYFTSPSLSTPAEKAPGNDSNVTNTESKSPKSAKLSLRPRTTSDGSRRFSAFALVGQLPLIAAASLDIGKGLQDKEQNSVHVFSSTPSVTPLRDKKRYLSKSAGRRARLVVSPQTQP